MKYIVVKSSIYKLNERQFLKIKKLKKKFEENFPSPHSKTTDFEKNIDNHLKENIKNYKYLGEIDFYYM